MELVEEMCVEYVVFWNKYVCTDLGDYVDFKELNAKLDAMKSEIFLEVMKSFGYEFNGFHEIKISK